MTLLMPRLQWQSAFENLGVGVAQIASDGTWAANRSLRDLLGYAPENLPKKQFDAVILPEDLQAEQQNRKRLLNGEITNYSSERSAICENGQRVPVRLVFSLEQREHSKKLEHILATVEDLSTLRQAETALGEAEIARREVGHRLATAQENERTRIARELHDDIGQSLAILRMQMMRAGKPVSGVPGEQHPSVANLCEQLRTIATKVSRISHQLHSAKLEYLGLAVAVRAHCREFSEKYKMAVECSCDHIPEHLDGLIGLSLLRVVQEALHNIGKHSRATSVQVKLQGSATEVLLTVADDGVGFRVEEARLAAGIGLISMRERIYLAGGEFSISSGPGSGTLITARVPLVQGDLSIASPISA